MYHRHAHTSSRKNFSVLENLWSMSCFARTLRATEMLAECARRLKRGHHVCIG